MDSIKSTRTYTIQITRKKFIKNYKEFINQKFQKILYIKINIENKNLYTGPLVPIISISHSER